VGAPGSGFALYPSDGLFNSPSEAAYYNIPGAHFATLQPGTHTVHVRGLDQAGNWGPTGSATITIVGQVADTTAPVVTNVVATPNPTGGASTVTLTAMATDTQSSIAGAVWFQGATPPKNARQIFPMTASDGTFNSLTEEVRATIDVRKWKTGTYDVSVRAYDAAGNWSSIVTIRLGIGNTIASTANRTVVFEDGDPMPDAYIPLIVR
jgi:hypothetical protein